jgi:hypothetical protein
MSNSIATVLEQGEALVGELMFADPDFAVTFPTTKIDELVDTLYDYLTDPDQAEISAMQAQLAPLAGLLAQTPLPTKTTQLENVPASMQPAIAGYVGKFAEYGPKMTTTRLAEAFKKASGGMSLEEHAAISAERIKHAVDTDTLNELMSMQQSGTNSIVAANIQGILGFVTSDKLLPFMQTLAQKLDKDELKETLSYAIKQGLKIKNGLESTFDNLEEELEAKFGDREPSDFEMEAFVMESTTEKMLTPIFQAITPSETGAQRVHRIATAIEESLLESGAISEDAYLEWAQKAQEKQLKSMRGYDAMNGFDAKAAIKLVK